MVAPIGPVCNTFCYQSLLTSPDVEIQDYTLTIQVAASAKQLMLVARRASPDLRSFKDPNVEQVENMRGGRISQPTSPRYSGVVAGRDLLACTAVPIPGIPISGYPSWCPIRIAISPVIVAFVNLVKRRKGSTQHHLSSLCFSARTLLPPTTHTTWRTCRIPSTPERKRFGGSFTRRSSSG
jgi:hypothetical protein